MTTWPGCGIGFVTETRANAGARHRRHTTTRPWEFSSVWRPRCTPFDRPVVGDLPEPPTVADRALVLRDDVTRLTLIDEGEGRLDRRYDLRNVHLLANDEQPDYDMRGCAGRSPTSPSRLA